MPVVWTVICLDQDVGPLENGEDLIETGGRIIPCHGVGGGDGQLAVLERRDQEAGFDAAARHVPGLFERFAENGLESISASSLLGLDVVDMRLVASLGISASASRRAADATTGIEEAAGDHDHGQQTHLRRR